MYGLPMQGPQMHKDFEQCECPEGNIDIYIYIIYAECSCTMNNVMLPLTTKLCLLNQTRKRDQLLIYNFHGFETHWGKLLTKLNLSTGCSTFS